MQPTSLLLILVAAWSLSDLWLLPRIHKQWKSADLGGKVARAGLLTAVEKLRDLSAAGSIAVGCVMLLVAASGFLAGTNLNLPKAIIEGLAAAYGVAKSWSKGFQGGFAAMVLAAAAAALFFTGRAAKRAAVGIWMKRAAEIHAALYEQPERIEAARSNAALRPYVEKIDSLLGELNRRAGMGQSEEAEGAGEARLRGLLNEAVSLLAIETARREIDFKKVVATSSDETTPRSLLRQLSGVLISRKLSEDAGLVKRPLSLAVTGLLFVSLIGWSAEPLANSLRLAVNNLRVNAVDRDADRDLQQALSRTTPNATNAAPPVLVRNVTSAAQIVARALARQMVRAPLLGPASRDTPSITSESEFVREALVERHIDAGQASNDTRRVRDEIAHAVAAGETSQPSSLEQQLQARVLDPLERLQSTQPGPMQQALARLEARYGARIGAVDAEEALTEQVLAKAFGSVDAGAKGAIAEQAQDLLKDVGQDAVKKWADAAVKRFVADMVANAARHDVQNALRFEISARNRDFLASLRAARGSNWSFSKAEEDAQKSSRAVAQMVAGQHGRLPEAERESLVQRLSGYDALFPRDDNLPTEPGLLAAAPEGASGGGGLGGGGGGGGSSGRTQRRGGPVFAEEGGYRGFAISRAMNVRLASVSFRVRGVLIGQDLEGIPLDATDLRWKIRPAAPGASTRVELELRVADGTDAPAEWRAVGVFDAGVVDQALRYAADGRVIATTITAGDGKVLSRLTYLHPVLKDTPLGCRVIEADRLVDTFTVPGGARRPSPTVAELANDREQMYRWIRTMNLAEQVAAVDTPKCPLKDIQHVVQTGRFLQVRFSPVLSATIDDFVHNHGASDPSSTSLLQAGGACATGPVDSLAECLCREVKPKGLGGRYWFPEDHTSQLRERATRLSSDLSWLRPSPDHLEHFDFWTHTTFSLRYGTTGRSDEASAAAMDFPGQQLALLRREVTARLPGYLSNELRMPYDDFMAPLEQFVLVERLARVAFKGGLGQDFPLPRLVELEKATRSFVPHQPTLQWEAVASPRDLFEALRKVDESAAEQFANFHDDAMRRARDGQPRCDSASM